MISPKTALACAGVAVLLCAASARAAFVDFGFFAEARGTSSVFTPVFGSSADVWFRSGAYVGTPTAAGGGTFIVAPLAPGATTVAAGLTA